ncbi:MAG: hypothetical protein IE891_09385, partial [Flavobacteriaceae bacterium]|nr:hypothetical protein [Flavobacteriaceae bacterium]
MNKQKFKWNLFLLSISLLFFISCLNEDTITEIETGKKIKIGYVDYANVQHLKPNVENFKSKHQNLRTNSFENLDLDLTRI